MISEEKMYKTGIKNVHYKAFLLYNYLFNFFNALRKMTKNSAQIRLQSNLKKTVYFSIFLKF